MAALIDGDHRGPDRSTRTDKAVAGGRYPFPGVLLDGDHCPGDGTLRMNEVASEQQAESSLAGGRREYGRHACVRVGRLDVHVGRADHHGPQRGNHARRRPIEKRGDDAARTDPSGAQPARAPRPTAPSARFRNEWGTDRYGRSGDNRSRILYVCDEN
jgi:hypothetical protein